MNPSVIKVEIQAALYLGKKTVVKRRSMHVGIGYPFTSQALAEKEVLLEYCPTEDVTVDVVTNSLGNISTGVLRASMGLRASTQCHGEFVRKKFTCVHF